MIPDQDELQVDVAVLSRVFSKTTNSYKYLFFLSLLELNLEGEFKRSCYTLDEIVVRMMRIGWYPHRYFHLSFGVQDKIGGIIDGLDLTKQVVSSSVKFKEALADNYSAVGSLSRYVPYRFLSPFLAVELKVLEKGENRSQIESKKNSRIVTLSNELFDSKKLLYRFVDGRALEMHPSWLHYLRHNYPLVNGWAKYEWVQYLQERNKSVPAITKKTNAPLTRNLQSQRDWWSRLLHDDEYQCIYTGDVIYANDYALDHYLPWSFVGHDQLWNLVPISKTVNSAKSDNIPSNKYLNELISLQSRALKHSHAIMKQQQWENKVQGYMLDFKIADHNLLLDETTIKNAYLETIPPLVQIASSIGFSTGWKA